MNQAPRRRKGRPFNPAHDRMARDLLRNAQVTPIEVDDPYEQGGVILVMQSTRDDPLAEMRARGQIDECDYQAGRHWQRAYEDAEIGGVRGIDPTKEAVDGGRIREVLTDRQLRAAKELKDARENLGSLGIWIVVSVLGTRMNLLDLAKRSAGKEGPIEGEYRYLRRRFKTCLSTLAVLFGYAQPTRA